MDKIGKLILLLAAFIILIAGAAILYNQLQDTEPTEQLVSIADQSQNRTDKEQVSGNTNESTEETAETMTAPDFTVYDAQGNAVHLSDYFGKPIVLNFWASWCGPCQSEMPDFEKKYLEHGDDVQFLMVNMTDGRETLDSAKRFIEDAGYTFPVFYDTHVDAAVAYGVYSLPTTYFIDAHGRLTAYATRAISAQLLRQGIDMIKK